MDILTRLTKREKWDPCFSPDFLVVILFVTMLSLWTQLNNKGPHSLQALFKRPLLFVSPACAPRFGSPLHSSSYCSPRDFTTRVCMPPHSTFPFLYLLLCEHISISSDLFCILSNIDYLFWGGSILCGE